MMYAAGVQDAETIFCGVSIHRRHDTALVRKLTVIFSGKNKTNTVVLH